MRYAIIDTDGEILSVDAMPHKERISIEVDDDFAPTYKKFDEKSKKFVENEEAKEKDRLAEVQNKRKSAYVEEADPLMFDYLEGKIEKSVWLEKKKEIRKRYPK